MLAPLATLAFFTAVWLVVMVAVEMLGQSGGKIAAALNGRSVLATAPSIRPAAVRVSLRAGPASALRAQPQLRVAA